MFGGIYCLRRSAQSLVVNESKRSVGSKVAELIVKIKL